METKPTDAIVKKCFTDFLTKKYTIYYYNENSLILNGLASLRQECSIPRASRSDSPPDVIHNKTF